MQNPKLESVLDNQYLQFEEVHSKMPDAFQTMQGDSCLRVAIVYSENTSQIIDVGYEHTKFGFNNQEELKKAVVDHFKKKQLIYLKLPKTSLLDTFDTLLPEFE